MDLQNTWNNSGGVDEDLGRLLAADKLKRLHSRMPLLKLKTTLESSILVAVIITAGYIYLLIVTTTWQVQLSLVIMSLFNSWIIIDSWRLYKGINAHITPGNNLCQELQRNYESFQRWWRLQERVALFIYPIAVAGGFMLGGVAGSGRPLSEFLYKTPVLIALAVCIVVLVPSCYYFARWMFNYAFGKQLKKLKDLIDEMEENGD